MFPTRRQSSHPAPPTAGRTNLLAWLTGPLLLLTGVVSVLLVTQGGAALFGWTLGSLFTVGLGWILISSLFPAEADRTCPECQGETLVRSDPMSTSGIRCVACGFEDADASSFLMAEQEGPIESTVLYQRGRLRRSIPRRRPRIVSSEPGASSTRVSSRVSSSASDEPARTAS